MFSLLSSVKPALHMTLTSPPLATRHNFTDDGTSYDTPFVTGVNTQSCEGKDGIMLIKMKCLTPKEDWFDPPTTVEVDYNEAMAEFFHFIKR